MNKIAKFFSWILSPMLLPTYGTIVALLTTQLALTPGGVRTNVTLAIFGITCLMPTLTILLLYKLGKITDLGLNKQDERLIPYTITIVSYCLAALYLHGVHAPRFLWMFMIAAAAVAATSAIINIWWKISAHMGAMGGLLGLMVRIIYDHLAICDMMVPLAVAIMLTGVLGTSRLILRCHTPAQVLAGTINGFLWTVVLT